MESWSLRVLKRPGTTILRSDMPPPIEVRLLPFDPRWEVQANAEMRLLAQVLGPLLVKVHHIGSTAIPGIYAKPIIDLMPTVSSLASLDGRRTGMESAGYEDWGELGLTGRRYFTKTEPGTGLRLIQLHCYEKGSSAIVRHLAFRDYLRAKPDVAADYNRVKAGCSVLHPADSHAYGDCKDAWIKMAEADAIRWYRNR